MNFSIKAPAGFDFKRTINSHGWCELLPFEWIDDATLVRVLDLPDAAPVTVTVTGDRRKLNVATSRRGEESSSTRSRRNTQPRTTNGKPAIASTVSGLSRSAASHAELLA